MAQLTIGWTSLMANSVRLTYSRGSLQTITGWSSLGQTPNRVLVNFLSSSSDEERDEDRYKSKAAEFSSSRSRDIAGQTIDIHEHVPNERGNDADADSHVDSYDTRGGLNLSSVMQTTVPEPYNVQGKRAPTHLNMPGGQVQQRQKYLSDDLHRTHYQTNHNKDYHTWNKYPAGAFQNCLTERRNLNINHLIVNFSTNPALHVQSTENSASPPPDKMSQRLKLKQTIMDYGATVTIFHVSVALCSLGGFYLAISSGLDVAHVLAKLPLDKELVESSLATGLSTFALAYAVHKMFAPLRIALTVAAAPFIVRYLRKVGVLKPPKK